MAAQAGQPGAAERAFPTSRLRGADDEAARREMLREYKRRRAAMA